MSFLRIILVRHGETVHNKAGIMSGGVDVQLSGVGRAQAAMLARRFSREKIDAIFSSPLSRALDTARAIAGKHPGLRVQVVAALTEKSHGTYDGRHRRSVSPAHRAKMEENPADVNWRAPGAESWSDVLARLRPFAGRLRAMHGTIVVAGHGGTLTALLCELLGFPLELNRALAFKNTAVAEIVFKEGRVDSLVLNDTKHLPAGLDNRRRRNESFVRLFIVRHAQSEANIRRIVAGRTETPLTPDGIAQARKVGSLLSKEKIDSIHFSQSLRARRTAEEILRHHRHARAAAAPELSEKDFGFFEGQPREKWFAWKRKVGGDNLRERRHGGESWLDVRTRVKPFLAHILHGAEGRTIAIVTHSDVGRSILASLLGTDEISLKPFRLKNTGIAELAIGTGDRKGFVRIASFNENRHL